MLSSEHGRMRRAQRLLEKRDLQAARKYGTCVESLNQRGELNLKYTFAGVVYITDPTGTREITSWAEPGAGLDVELVEISNDMQQEHARACAALEADMRTWTSHTVIVVDQSGSMRNTDVAGGASRSDAVWLTLALDVIAKQLSAKQAGSTDVISVVGMNASANVLIDCKPWDWLAFNAVVKLLRTAEPSFDGNYLPALDAAEALLMRNTRGSCALQLLFLSDGRPSDRVKDQRLTGMVLPERLTIKMQESIQKLAGRFGRRLTVRTVGIGSSASNYSKSIDDFVLLKQMAEHSQLFGCEGHFIHASLRPEALGLALSSLATSLTKTRTELTELGSASQRAVRDVRREARNLMDEPVLTDALWCYKGASLPPCRLSWDFKMRDWVPAPFESAAGVGVAVRKSYFGEGAERLVRKLREVDASGAFVGPLLVAKEGRFQSDMNQLAGSGAVAFHRTFCDTQTRAQNLAHVFNSWLERVPGEWCEQLNATDRVPGVLCVRRARQLPGRAGHARREAAGSLQVQEVERQQGRHRWAGASARGRGGGHARALDRGGV